MTTLTDPMQTGATVSYEEPPFKPPPALVVGPLAWLRNNLFSSYASTILTIITSILIIASVVSFFTWAITQANWSVINFNIRQFNMGRYQADAEWRVGLTAVLIAFVIGASLAAWTRVSRVLVIVLLVVLALSFVIPAVTSPIPLPPTYLTAGDTTLTSGSATVEHVPQLGFIARAGETVQLRLATELSEDDQALQTLHSFGDVAANILRAAAFNRLTAQARIAEINSLMASDTPEVRTLTDNQKAALQTELDRLTVPDPVVDAYLVNQNPVAWRLLRGTTMEVLGEGVLEPDGFVTEVTLPEDGWYILEKTGEGTALIGSSGIYPLLERSYSRSEELDAAGNVISSAGRYSEYVRMTDGWNTQEVRPKIDGRDVPMTIIIDMQYRGDRTFTDWLVLYFSPFLKLINVPFLLFAIAGTVGYFLGRNVDRVLKSPKQARNPRHFARRISTWLLAATPVLMFVLIYGIGTSFLPITDTRRWGGLMLTVMLSIVGIIASFPLGVLLALGRRSSLPAIRIASTLYIEFVRGVPLITVLFMAQLLVPLVNPQLAEVDNVFRAMVGITLFSAAYLAENVRGGLQAIPHGQEEAAKALGLSGSQITLFITLPQALRLVIPALVGQAISLFKDTSLVAIVGLTDLTGITQVTVAQTEFLGTRREAYVFISIIYFVFCYVMAAVSRRIEASGSGAARRI